MDLLREILRFSHVALGFTGLVAFWFPVFARKGATLHRRAGKVFVWSGYGVTLSAALSCAVLTSIILNQGLTEHNRDNLVRRKLVKLLRSRQLVGAVVVSLRHFSRRQKHRFRRHPAVRIRQTPGPRESRHQSARE